MGIYSFTNVKEYTDVSWIEVHLTTPHSFGESVPGTDDPAPENQEPIPKY